MTCRVDSERWNGSMAAVILVAILFLNFEWNRGVSGFSSVSHRPICQEWACSILTNSKTNRSPKSSYCHEQSTSDCTTECCERPSHDEWISDLHQFGWCTELSSRDQCCHANTQSATKKHWIAPNCSSASKLSSGHANFVGRKATKCNDDREPNSPLREAVPCQTPAGDHINDKGNTITVATMISSMAHFNFQRVLGGPH